MKKLLVAAVALFCATAIVVQAQDAAPKKKKLTPEQKQVMDDMLAKYDTNKDGKLDKTERAAMSQEDKDKMSKAGLGMGKKKAAPAAEASTNAPAADK
jgi:ABC-type transporter MlaC component